jgi:hypothetical protein
MTDGHPGHQEIPGTFDPNQQPWPAYTREQYDTRQLDQPPVDYNAPVIVPGPRGGQLAPPANTEFANQPQYGHQGW